MIDISHYATTSPSQWEIIIEGMRNPMNSWDRSDSYKTHIENPKTLNTADFEFVIGNSDHCLMVALAHNGSTHAKYRRMIPVWVTINAPLYWWKEFDTYKVGTVANSCSTMHKIHDRDLTIDDFSCEHLTDEDGLKVFNDTLQSINKYRSLYLTAIGADKKKEYWYHMIQLLPSSYNQRRTVMLNYEVLASMYKDRHDHKLDEWRCFCDWIKELPYSDLIVGEE